MRSVRNFGSFDSQYTPFKQKTALDYLYPFLSFSVHNFCARTDGQTILKKFYFFLLIKNICIYMSIPISIIFQISPVGRSASILAAAVFRKASHLNPAAKFSTLLSHRGPIAANSDESIIDGHHLRWPIQLQYFALYVSVLVV